MFPNFFRDMEAGRSAGGLGVIGVELGRMVCSVLLDFVGIPIRKTLAPDRYIHVNIISSVKL